MAKVQDMKTKEVKITLLDGVERPIRFTLNALAELEDRYGTVEDAFKQLDNNSIKAVRFILWAGLMSDSPELTEQQVGSLIDVRYLQDLMESLGGALEQDLPQQENTTEDPN